MINWILLSHFITNNMPSYNGICSSEIISSSSIKNGDTTNSLSLNINTHTGTHIDFPKHFIDNGKMLDDYPPDYFIFNKVELVSIPLDSGIYVIEEMLSCRNICKDTELLIIQTGYSNYYGQEKYWKDNPGISFGAAKYLKSAYPKLRAVGVDFISLNAYSDKEEGRKAHRELLESPEVLIIEDMDLNKLKFKPNKVIVSPIPILGADGSPCNIIAEVNYEL